MKKLILMSVSASLLLLAGCNFCGCDKTASKEVVETVETDCESCASCGSHASEAAQEVVAEAEVPAAQ